MGKDHLVLSVVEKENRKISPIKGSLQFKYKTRDKRWIKTVGQKGKKKSNETLLVIVIVSSPSTASLLSFLALRDDCKNPQQ